MSAFSGQKAMALCVSMIVVGNFFLAACDLATKVIRSGHRISFRVILSTATLSLSEATLILNYDNAHEYS